MCISSALITKSSYPMSHKGKHFTVCTTNLSGSIIHIHIKWVKVRRFIVIADPFVSPKNGQFFTKSCILLINIFSWTISGRQTHPQVSLLIRKCTTKRSECLTVYSLSGIIRKKGKIIPVSAFLNLSVSM